LDTKPRSGRPPKLFLPDIKRAIKADPRRSLTDMAKDRHVHRRTVSRVVKKLGARSRRLQERPLLSAKNILDRKNRCKKLINNMKGAPAGRVIVFSDEKIFTVDP
jgi:hypothetical protein